MNWGDTTSFFNLFFLYKIATKLIVCNGSGTSPGHHTYKGKSNRRQLLDTKLHINIVGILTVLDHFFTLLHELFTITTSQFFHLLHLLNCIT